jgi:Asp-tRNA(Asn)/Glu-tRNA(Gln) amidotransferase A subunit family amidase
MGGSVRIPAALCGVLGMKPSHGRIPMDILSTVFDTISHFGPLARTVADMRLFMECVEGADDADILSQIAPTPFDDHDDISGLRIAASVDLGCFHVDPDIAANFQKHTGNPVASWRCYHTGRYWLLPADMVDAWYDYWCVYLAGCR